MRGYLDPFFAGREEVGELALFLFVQFSAPNSMIQELSAASLIFSGIFRSGFEGSDSSRIGLEVVEAQNG